MDSLTAEFFKGFGAGVFTRQAKEAAPLAEAAKVVPEAKSLASKVIDIMRRKPLATAGVAAAAGAGAATGVAEAKERKEEKERRKEAVRQLIMSLQQRAAVV